MKESIFSAIVALFCTSCLVRILPAFLSPQMGTNTQRYLERVLPAAVFINFAVYLAYSEVNKEPIAAAISLLLVGGVAFLNFAGLVTTSIAATGIYFFLAHLSHG